MNNSGRSLLRGRLLISARLPVQGVDTEQSMKINTFCGPAIDCIEKGAFVMKDGMR